MVKFFLFLLSCIQIAWIRCFQLDIIRKSKYLPENGRCLGVSPNHKILRLRCNRNHPSVRWLWTNSGHMMNLRTFRCLQAKTQRRSKTLILKQCDNNNLDQIWTCNRFSTIQNQGQKGFRKRWIRKHKKKSRSSLYFRDCNSDRSSYKGCYRFSDGQFRQLVNRSENFNTAEEQNCSLAFNVRAPIFIQHTYCSFDWINSKSSHDDGRWHYIQEDREEFSVHTKSPNETVLTIRNKSLLLKKWSGTLLRLEIVCKSNFSSSSENHCVLLEIANDKSAKMISSSVVPSSTSASTTLSTSTSTSSFTTPSLSPPTSSFSFSTSSSASTFTRTFKFLSTLTSPSPSSQAPTIFHSPDRRSTSESPGTASKVLVYPQLSTLPPDPGNDNQGRRSDEDSSNIILIVAPIVVLFCLLIATIGIMLLYRRRKRSNSKQDNIHLYEESNLSNNMRRERFAQPDDIQELSAGVYENPENQAIAQAEYEYPFHETVETNSQKNSQNDYDYATPEGTSWTSRKSNHNQTGNETSSFASTSLAFPANHLYQVIDDKPLNEIARPNGNVIDHQGSPGQPSESPFYHMLEDANKTKSDEKGIYERLDEKATSEPFYNVLEGP